MADAPEQFENAVCDTIRDYAMTFPQTTEGTSCVNRAFKAAGKNFVFLGEKGSTCTLRLKLDDSIAQIEERSSTDDGYEVGAGGWTKIVFDADSAPADDDLKTWVRESFLLLAPKKALADYTA